MTIETTIVSMLVIFTITIIVLFCHIVAINKNKDEQLKKRFQPVFFQRICMS